MLPATEEASLNQVIEITRTIIADLLGGHYILAAHQTMVDLQHFSVAETRVGRLDDTLGDENGKKGRRYHE